MRHGRSNGYIGCGCIIIRIPQSGIIIIIIRRRGGGVCIDPNEKVVIISRRYLLEIVICSITMATPEE
jgi:hypothetical protein